MPIPRTPTFEAELPLIVTPEQERVLEIKLEALRNIYNAALGESLRRLRLMRESKAWVAARKIKDKKERSLAFRKIVDEFEFNTNAIEKFTKDCRNNSWLHVHIGSMETQAMTKRAFRAVQQYGYGKVGRPRFKGKRGIHSIEGKRNGAGLVFTGNKLRWKNLILPALLDPKDKDGWQTQALACRTKYCKIVKRSVKGKVRWYCQLVQEGLPPKKTKNVVVEGSVGLDIGPSTVAVVSDVQAELHTFCSTVRQPWKESRRIQRAMDRSRRATNTNNYLENGTIKPGKKIWNKSSRYKKLQRRLHENERRLASERKRSHGELCNKILSQGKEIKTEKVSYRAFQRSFGRSVGARGPGMFISMLTCKAEQAGGSIIMINTRTTKLSQYDHITRTYTKKPLSQRIHIFGDGKTEPIQRDLYSAFLAKNCSQDSLNVPRVDETWAAAEPLLRRATLRWFQSTRRSKFIGPHGGIRRSRSPVEKKVGQDEVLEVVVGPQTVSAKKSHDQQDLLRTASAEVQDVVSPGCAGVGRLGDA